MAPSILVLVNSSASAERAARYAAELGAPLGAHLTLLHLPALVAAPALPVLLAPELAGAAAPTAGHERAEQLAGLQALARQLPIPATFEEATGPVCSALAAAVRQHRPQLLVLGLSPEHDLLDHLLHHQLLPTLRATHLPVLLVPEAAPAPGEPQRLLFALDGAPFTPNAAARHLAPLLAASPSTYIVTHVLDEDEAQEATGRLLLAELRASLLLPTQAPVQLYQVAEHSPAAGILRACEDTYADLVVLMARPRSFLKQLFHRSVTARVLRHCQVPVLLLPTEEAG
ncbi:universal stress protein [Hymenobacter properus]|uniref:Universal stress protein n=1 Tax=Hymenobacter properus TaxID=2791026 RepID=A0A931FKC0_9BACT|nr:universal stress protein [Hymenobacter properus]MBF9142873.1 universal stress protein [Hymenobacter properus]MBR7721680.1 universal stress protein [Microvirga sp. SRT04]